MKFFVNFLSAFRIIASFIIPIALLSYATTPAFILFILAALSDFFDGFLARKYNACTKLGTVLDSVADKFLVINTFIALCVIEHFNWLVVIPIFLMISRELYISGLREFAGTQKITPPHAEKRFSMGKIKTTAQMVSIIAFLALFILSDFVRHARTPDFLGYYYYALSVIAMLSLWFALVASIWSATEYTIDVVKKLKK